jgi:hypothetical protein
MEARHPVNGGSGDEFSSRLLYDDEVLEINSPTDVRKQGHALEARVDLPAAQNVSGYYRYTKSENQRTKNEVKSNAGKVSWFAPLGRKFRLNASFLKRKIESTDVPIDLPNWREGRPGGGQDFDYVRKSAYDRDENLINLQGVYRLAPRHSLRFGYRMRSTDRENFVLDPDDETQTTTTQHSIKAAWNGRLSKALHSRVGITYDMIDKPFVNVRGICESAIGDSASIGGQPNEWVYYWQRERIGTGTSQPNKALRLNANLNYNFTPAVMLTGYLNYTDEKNDELNVYTYDGSSANVGAQVMLLPDTRYVIVGGGSWTTIESNAKICATVMDG